MSQAMHDAADVPGVPALDVTGAWETVFRGAAREALEAALPRFVMPRRWFGSKARAIRTIRIIETIPILRTAYLTLLRFEYVSGEPETYVLPVAFVAGATAQGLGQERPAAVIATLQTGQESGILYDAVWDPGFRQAFLEAISQRRHYRGTSGDLIASASSALPRLPRRCVTAPPTGIVRGRAEQYVDALRRPAHPEALPAP